MLGFGQLEVILGAIVTFGVAIFGAFFAGRRKGAKSERDAQMRKRLSDVRKAQEVREDVEILDDDELARRASQYVRGRRD